MPVEHVTREECFRRSLFDEVKSHGDLLLDADGKAWFNAYWEWMRFHLPRIGTNLASKMIHATVEDAVRRRTCGMPLGIPPVVPDHVKTMWDGNSGRESCETSLLNDAQRPVFAPERTVAPARECVSQPFLNL